MKRIIIFFNHAGKHAYPLDDPDYAEAYVEFAAKIEAAGGEVYIARTQQTYLGGSRFSSGWKYEKGALIEISSPIEGDVIFNKGNLIWDDTATVINIQDVENFCTDKSLAYEQFREFYPLSLVVHNSTELREACERIPSTMIVAKPLDREGGEGVHIALCEEIVAFVQEFPYLIQEFIDTSAGIPGIVKGHHDLRIVCVDGDITFCQYRTPPSGSLLANVSQGGTLKMVPLKDIPRGALDLFAVVENYMSRFPKRIYSVDMGRNIDGRWLIIEMNSKPGLNPVRFGPDYAVFQDRIASLLLDVAENGIG